MKRFEVQTSGDESCQSTAITAVTHMLHDLSPMLGESILSIVSFVESTDIDAGHKLSRIGVKWSRGDFENNISTGEMHPEGKVTKVRAGAR